MNEVNDQTMYQENYFNEPEYSNLWAKNPRLGAETFKKSGQRSEQLPLPQQQYFYNDVNTAEQRPTGLRLGQATSPEEDTGMGWVGYPPNDRNELTNPERLGIQSPNFLAMAQQLVQQMDQSGVLSTFNKLKTPEEKRAFMSNFQRQEGVKKMYSR